MTAAIFGLVGVVVGAGLQLVGQFFMTRRTERHALLAAGRTIVPEFREAIMFVELALDGEWYWLSALGDPIEAWDKYKTEPVLAGRLSDHEWKMIEDARLLSTKAEMASKASDGKLPGDLMSETELNDAINKLNTAADLLGRKLLAEPSVAT